MKLILAPSYLHESILEHYRKDNPFSDVKVIDLNEVEAASSYKVKDSALAYLMKEHNFSYDIAKMYLQNLIYNLDESVSKYSILKPLQDELVSKGYLYNLSHLKPLLSDKTALVIGYQKEDEELKYFAEKLNLSLEYFEFEKTDKLFLVKRFKQLEEEVYYVLNEIAHDLDSGVDITDIVLVRRDTTYDYYLKKYCESFGYQINVPNNITCYQTGVFSLFNKLILECRNFDEALEKLSAEVKEDERSLEFIEVVKRNIIEEDFELAYDYLVHKLCELKVSDARYYPAVELSENIPFATGKKIYLLGFAQGSFPRTGKDTSFLSMEDQAKLHLNSVKEDIKYDQANIINFLSLDNEYYISYSEKSLSNSEYQKSPILVELNVDEKKNLREPYIYSESALKHLLTAAKDSEFFYKEVTEDLELYDSIISDDYRTYDNRYTGAKAVKRTEKLTLSYSSVNNFYNCPFKYYLSTVLKIDPFEESNSMILGNITHEILQNAFDMDRGELEEMFDRLVDMSNADEELKPVWKANAKRLTFQAVDAIKKHRNYMADAVFETEEDYNKQIDKYTVLYGKIDKAIIIDNSYIFLVDYKSGSSGDFEPDKVEYGLSLQLPTYAYLLTDTYGKKKYKISGLYINHILSNKRFLDVEEDELIPESLQLSGLSINDLNVFSKFDSTIADGTSSFVASTGIKKDGTPTGKGFCGESYIKELAETAKAKYEEANIRIRNNEFDISPIAFTNSKTPCEWCSYKDICFVRHNQLRLVSKKKGDADGKDS